MIVGLGVAGAWLVLAAAAAIALGRAIHLADQRDGCCPHPGADVPTGALA